MGQQMRVKCPRRSSASSTHLSPLESCTRAAEKVINHVVPLLLAVCLFLWVLFAGGHSAAEAVAIVLALIACATTRLPQRRANDGVSVGRPWTI